MQHAALVAAVPGGSGPRRRRPKRLLAVTRAPGAAFSTPEVVASAFDIGGTLAFDPATRSPVAAYVTHGADFLPTTAVATRPPL